MCINICIQYNKDGRPSGDADVDFASHEEAQEAMRRNKALMRELFNRTLNFTVLFNCRVCLDSFWVRPDRWKQNLGAGLFTRIRFYTHSFLLLLFAFCQIFKRIYVCMYVYGLVLA